MLTQAGFQRGGSSIVNPSTLTLAGYWRANFTGSPWTGVASAGSSGSRNLTEATNPPATGAAVNGLTPADFDGTNDRLASAVAISSFISDTAGSIWSLFRADTAIADAGASAYYSNPGLFMNAADGYLGLTFSTSGVRLGSYDGIGGFNSVAVACGTGAWHLAQARWNSTTIEVRVDSGAWQTLAKAVGASGSANGIYVGVSYGGASNFFDGKILELGCAQSRFSDTGFDDIKSYVNTTYALAL